ncbi:MAG: hypothetical protein ACT4RN_22325 [Pseudonocardia sp.]
MSSVGLAGSETSIADTTPGSSPPVLLVMPSAETLPSWLIAVIGPSKSCTGLRRSFEMS